MQPPQIFPSRRAFRRSVQLMARNSPPLTAGASDFLHAATPMTPQLLYTAHRNSRGNGNFMAVDDNSLSAFMAGRASCMEGLTFRDGSRRERTLRASY